VIFDTLVQQSKPAKFEAVLSHELRHWYYLHLTKLMVISQLHLFAILALFPAFLHAPPFLIVFDFPSSVSKNPPPIVAFLLFQLILVPLEAFISIGVDAVSRQFEWEADRFALELEDNLGDKEIARMREKLGKTIAACEKFEHSSS